MTKYQLFPTTHGIAGIAWNGRGITVFRLPAETAEETRRSIRRRVPDAAEGTPPVAVASVIQAVTRYFDGEKMDFFDVPIDLGHQEPLFVRIYDHVRRLAWGETTTYGAVAKALGEGPEIARDVGRAMARNPVPLILPCHRVLAAGGRIGGFSAPGGSDAKARMLALEGVRPESIDGSKSDAQPSFGF